MRRVSEDSRSARAGEEGFCVGTTITAVPPIVSSSLFLLSLLLCFFVAKETYKQLTIQILYLYSSGFSPRTLPFNAHH